MKIYGWSNLLVLFYLHILSSANDVQNPLGFEENQSSKPFRVAIIGAGAAGSTAAYYLRNFKDEICDDNLLNITIFDTNSRIGGRTTTVNAFDQPIYPVELGASIFVEVNHILYNLSRGFGLPPKTDAFIIPEESDYELGVWDGAHFLFKQSKEEGRWQGWWNIAKLLWKYGLSPIKTQRAMKSTVGRFLQFYNSPIFPFSSLNHAVEEADLLKYVSSSGKEVLEEAGISPEFSRDIIEASTRVNYAQNLDAIHGLETMVCMAIEGAMAIQGGNWQIFATAVNRSNAVVHLNTTVTQVSKTKTGSYLVQINHDAHTEEQPEYDAIILAAPYQFSKIKFSPPLQHTPMPIEYVELHVTLFTSPHLLSPDFFNVESQAEVPNTILTAIPEGFNPGAAQGLDAVGPSAIWSISTHGIIQHPINNSTQYLYKIFSPAPMTGTFLSSMLGFSYSNTSTSDPLSDLPVNDITWLHEKVWHSYPYEVPRTTFEHIRLDGSLDPEGFPRGRGVWYTSGIESFISTMETSALSGMNVARLIIDEAFPQLPNESGPMQSLGKTAAMYEPVP